MKAQEMSEQERGVIAHLQDIAKALENAPAETQQFIADWNASVTREFWVREGRRREKGKGRR